MNLFTALFFTHYDNEKRVNYENASSEQFQLTAATKHNMLPKKRRICDPVKKAVIYFRKKTSIIDV